MEIIAEIGQNHDGDLDRAVEMIRAAKAGGADAAKFQVFDARAVFAREGNPWWEYNLRTELSRDRVLRLADECRRAGIEFFASAFDPERVGWLEEAGVRRHKVASRSVRDEALLSAIGRTGKPVLVSLGMRDEPGFPPIPVAEVGYLHCVSLYPAPLETIRLETIDFGRYAGFSDHTVGLTAAAAAFARGARIVEKHFTLDKGAYGPDHASSMDPDDLRRLATFRDELRRCL